MARRLPLTGTPNQAPATTSTLDAIELPPRSRGLLVGMTGTGKSTLGEHLIRRWLDRHGDKARVLIVDTKPRFRAEWQLNGLPARRLYRQLEPGPAVPGSYRLELADPHSELKRIWHEYGGRVAISQTDLRGVPWQRAAVQAFYNLADYKHESLIYYDEFADFFGSSGLASYGDPGLQAIRAGRERHVGVLAASQRPKGIPKSSLTEMTQLYYFQTAYDQDLGHIQEMGIRDPIDRRLMERDKFIFYAWSRDGAPRGYYRLSDALGGKRGAAWAGMHTRPVRRPWFPWSRREAEHATA